MGRQTSLSLCWKITSPESLRKRDSNSCLVIRILAIVIGVRPIFSLARVTERLRSQLAGKEAKEASLALSAFQPASLQKSCVGRL